MKNHNLKKIGLLGLLAGLATTTVGAVILSDTFELSDTLDTSYLGAFNSAGTSVTTGALFPTNYLFNDATSGFSMVRAQLPADTRLNLAIGETLTLSFDFRYSGTPNSSSNGFRFGLFDSTGLGTVVNAGTGSGNTLLTIVHDTLAGVNSDMGSGTNGAVAFTGPGDVVSNGTMTTGILSTAVSATLAITRTSVSAVTITTALNGGTASVTDLDDAGDAADYLVSFSSGYLVIRSGVPVNDFAIDNISIVPEPSTVALLGGLAALGLVLLRRRLRDQ